MLRVITVLLLMLIFSVITMPVYGQSQEFEPLIFEWTPTGLLGLGFQDKALKPRFSRVLYDRPEFVTDFTLNLPFGFYTNIWGSVGLDDAGAGSQMADEVDINLGWKGKVPIPVSNQGEMVDIRVSTGIFSFYPFDQVSNDLLVQTLAVSKIFDMGEWYGSHTLCPEFKVEWVFPATNVSQSAAVLNPNVMHRWKSPFGIKELTFFDQVGVQWNSAIGKNAGDEAFLQFNTGLEIQIFKNVKIVPGVFLVSPLGSTADGRDFEISGRVMTVISF